MDETPICPYCSVPVRTDHQIEYDQRVRLRCDNCGGVFEFLSGFGSFSVEGGHGADTRIHPRTERRWARDVGDDFDNDSTDTGKCTKGMGCICCLCIAIPSLLTIVLTILLSIFTFF